MKVDQLKTIIKECIKHVLKEEEFVDPFTGEVAPGPRDRIPGEENDKQKNSQWEYIDNGFYKISDQLAKKLNVGKLPGAGMEKLVKAPTGFKTQNGYVWLAMTRVNQKPVWSIRDSGGWKLDKGLAVLEESHIDLDTGSENSQWIHQKGSDYEIWGVVLNKNKGGGEMTLTFTSYNGSKSGKAAMKSTKNWYPIPEKISSSEVPDFAKDKIKQQLIRLGKSAQVSERRALVEPDIDKDREFKTDPVMAAVNLEEVSKPYKFIVVGQGSGNVYYVSNSDSLEKTLEEFKDETVRTGEDADSVGHTNPKIVQSGEGYLGIEVPSSDEGHFLVIDINSSNPIVQQEIKDLNLIKYADEYLKDREEYLSEMSTTGGADGYQTPFAFSKRGYSKRGLEGSKKLG